MENSPAVADKPTAMASLSISGNLLDVMLDVARRSPRNLEIILGAAKQEIAIVPELAKRCYYSIPFSNKDTDTKTMVEGPSIKLANVVSRLFKNMVVSGRIVEEDATRIKVEGLCYDLENNVLRTAPISVSKTYVAKGGKGVRFFPADQLNRQVQSGISKGIRNAVFNVVPAWLVDQCFQYAKHLVLNPPAKQGAVVESVQSRIQKARAIFKKDYKVTGAEMDTYIADNCDTMDENALLVHLIGLDTALQEGTANADQVFGRTSSTNSGMPEEKPNDQPSADQPTGRI